MNVQRNKNRYFLKWQQVRNANAYYISYKKDNGKFVAWKRVSKNTRSVDITSLLAGEAQTMKIKVEAVYLFKGKVITKSKKILVGKSFKKTS